MGYCVWLTQGGTLVERHAARSTLLLPACAAALGIIAVPATSTAQTTTGWAVDRYEPTTAGDVFFASEFPWYSGRDPVAIRFGILGDYAHNPLVRRPQGGGASQPLISDMLVLHPQ